MARLLWPVILDAVSPASDSTTAHVAYPDAAPIVWPGHVPTHDAVASPSAAQIVWWIRIALGLDTAARHPIQNEQVQDCPASDPVLKRTEQILEEQWGRRTERRSGPTTSYNCHGLTFASRRTGIDKTPVLMQILREDGYVEVEPRHVKRGDTVVYFADDNDVEHSAIVVTPAPTLLEFPVVVSKWGNFAERIHRADVCPYNWHHLRYFRVERCPF